MKHAATILTKYNHKGSNSLQLILKLSFKKN